MRSIVAKWQSKVTRLLKCHGMGAPRHISSRSLSAQLTTTKVLLQECRREKSAISNQMAIKSRETSQEAVNTNKAIDDGDEEKKKGAE